MSKQFTLRELAELTDATLIGDPDVCVENDDTLESATKKDVSFLANPRYREAMLQTQAGVICIDKNFKPTEEKNFLVSDNPSLTFQKIVELISDYHEKQMSFEGIHQTAVIHPSARIGKHVSIGPHVVIDKNVHIEDHTQIFPHVSIGPDVTIGEGCILYAGVIIRESCKLGNRVILQPGAVIGSCGFGYTTNPKTGHHTKLKQVGCVIIEDDVEIGANSAIDRARFKATTIKKGTKIDNLVQIAHNVTLGENNIIVSQSGIAGSTKLGNNVFLGGQAGIVGHVEITDNVKIATRGGVSKSIPDSGIYGGSPVTLLPESHKAQVHLRKLQKYVLEIADLKKRIEKLEKN